MRHRRRKRVNLNRGRRIGIFRSLLKGLLVNGRVKTSTARAKQIQVLTEKLVTLAKKDTLSHRRDVSSVVQDKDLVKKLFSEIAPRYTGRNGGYTQLLKLGLRKGDGCPISLLSLLP